MPEDIVYCTRDFVYSIKTVRSKCMGDTCEKICLKRISGATKIRRFRKDRHIYGWTYAARLSEYISLLDKSWYKDWQNIERGMKAEEGLWGIQDRFLEQH